jgi:hypothetical protein
MTRKDCKDIRLSLDGALKDVGARHNVTFTVGSMTYTDIGLTVRLEATHGDQDEAERLKFREAAPSFGLSDDDYGRTFSVRGRHFALIALKTRSPKRPYVGREISTGRQFNFTEAEAGLLSITGTPDRGLTLIALP